MGQDQPQYEYLPEEYRGSFKCNDEELNRIWEVGAYTMHLTTREFFIDGGIWPDELLSGRPYPVPKASAMHGVCKAYAPIYLLTGKDGYLDKKGDLGLVLQE